MLAYQYCEIINDTISQFVTTEQLKKKEGVTQIREGIVTSLTSITEDKKVYQVASTYPYTVGDTVLFSLGAQSAVTIHGKAINSSEVPIKVLNDAACFVKRTEFWKPSYAVCNSTGECTYKWGVRKSNCTRLFLKGNLTKLEPITITINNDISTIFDPKEEFAYWGNIPWTNYVEIIVSFKKMSILDVEVTGNGWEDNSCFLSLGTDISTVIEEYGEGLTLSAKEELIYKTKKDINGNMTFFEGDKERKTLKVFFVIPDPPCQVFGGDYEILPEDYSIELYRKAEEGEWGIDTSAYWNGMNYTVILSADEAQISYKVKIVKNYTEWESNVLTFSREEARQSDSIRALSFLNFKDTNEVNYWLPNGELDHYAVEKGIMSQPLVLRLTLPENVTTALLLGNGVEVSIEGPDFMKIEQVTPSTYSESCLLVGRYTFIKTNPSKAFGKKQLLSCSLYLPDTGEQFSTSVAFIPDKTDFLSGLQWALYREGTRVSCIKQSDIDEVAHLIKRDVSYTLVVNLYDDKGQPIEIESIIDQNNNIIWYQTDNQKLYCTGGSGTKYYRDVSGSLISSSGQIIKSASELQKGSPWSQDSNAISWSLNSITIGFNRNNYFYYQYAVVVNDLYYFGVDIDIAGNDAYTGSRQLEYGTNRVLIRNKYYQVALNDSSDGLCWEYRPMAGLDPITITNPSNNDQININYFNPTNKKSMAGEIIATKSEDELIVPKSSFLNNEVFPLQPIVVQKKTKTSLLKYYVFYLSLKQSEQSSPAFSSDEEKQILSAILYDEDLEGNSILIGERGIPTNKNTQKVGIFGKKGEKQFFELTKEGFSFSFLPDNDNMVTFSNSGISDGNTTVSWENFLNFFKTQ